jgi:hypothetical protein
MSDSESIDIASRRLTLALDALEAAAERRRELDRGQEALFTQLHALGTDRLRLASDLDEATARARRPPARAAWKRQPGRSPRKSIRRSKVSAAFSATISDDA